MHRSMRFAPHLVGGALLVIFGTPLTYAQTPPPEQPSQSTEGLSEIVVTAQRVAQNLQNVPISVTALDASQLTERNITDLTKLTEYVPNLNFLNSTGASSSSGAFAFIRGIGQTNPFLQNDPGVGIYIDGVYIGRTQGSVFNVLDLQRIEVLRGPQGTLYGQNTIGGAINLVTNTPKSQFAATGDLEGGNYSMVNGTAKINVPLTDTLFASLALSGRHHTGYVQPVINSDCPTCTQQALTNQNDVGARLAVRYQPGGEFTLDFTADYSHQNNLPLGVRLLTYHEGLFSFPGAPPGPSYDTVVGMLWEHTPSYFVNPNYNTSQSGFAGRDYQQVWGTAVTATWTMDLFTLKSITAYRTMHINTANDGDGAPIGLFANAYDFIHQDQLSEEIQLFGKAFGEHLDWLVGIYGWKENANENEDFAIYQETNGLFPGAFLGIPCFTWNPADPPFNGGCGDNGAQYTNLGVASGAVYLNGTYHVTSAFDVTAGIRYTYDRKTFYYSQVGAPQEYTDAVDHWSHFTPRVALEYHLTKQAMLYTSFAEGFKSGNFNNGNYIAAGGNRAVEPETVKAYEVGAKTTWLDDRLTANLAAFYSDYNDQQLQVTEENGNGLHAFVNAGASHIYGGELEFRARPTTNLLLDASGGYTQTKITEVLPGTIGVTEGAQLPYTPKWSGTLSATLTIPMGTAGDTDLRGDWSYLGAQNGDAQNTESLVTPGRALANFRATYRPMNPHWQVYFFIDNAFDKQYRAATYSAFAAQFTVGIDGAPRTYGGGFAFDF